MKFCFKCGSPLSGTEKFCPRCGQNLQSVAPAARQEAPTPQQTAQQQSAPQQPVLPQQPVHQEDKGKRRKCSRHGIIFTDITVLSEVLRTESDVLVKLFDQYTDLMAEADVDYRVVDVSDYKFVSKAAGRKGQQASFTEDSPWWDYQHVLFDIMSYEKEKGLPESNYLFIIGGHEVIPVPSINHYVKDPKLDDKDIETDVLYSYPYGPHTQYSLESTELYGAEMYFYTSRLPVPSDADVSYLVNYFQNALDCRGGVQVRKMYAQSDPHWKKLTAWLLAAYSKAGILPDKSNLSGKFCYGNVMLGPDITYEYIPTVLEKDTDFIYLNLHGSSHPDNPHYAGEYPENTQDYATIFPLQAMGIPTNYNVFVAEACYGGRYVGYDTMHSIIQAGLSNKTVIGLASSRIAFGGSEPPGGNADTMCGLFTAYLMDGYCAADAFIMARMAFFGENSHFGPYQAATLAEFNLFGDPTLRVIPVVENGSKHAKVTGNLAPKDFVLGYEVDDLKSADKPQSLLDQVRGAVDANIAAISRSIGEQLYAKYGLSPREPETIKRIRYRNGSNNLIYTYMNGKSSWVVTADPSGKIESVMTSK